MTLRRFPLNVPWQNLAERNSDEVTVTLDYRKTSEIFGNENELRVAVVNHRTGEDFTLYPNPADALNVYYHPYAYATRALQSGRMDRVA